MDSCLPVGLARARIFCRCYSLVLNVGNPVNFETGGNAVHWAGMGGWVGFDVHYLLMVWHKGLSYCMFLQIGVFSNFRRGMGDATFLCRARALLNSPKKKDINIHSCIIISKCKVIT